MLSCVPGLYPVGVHRIPFPAYHNLKCLPTLPGAPPLTPRGRRAQLRTADLDQWLSALSMRWNLLKQSFGPTLIQPGMGPKDWHF